MPVRTQENIFPEELFRKIADRVDHGRWHYGWKSNRSMESGHWNQDYAPGGTAWNSLDIAPAIACPTIRAAWDHVKTTMFPDARLIRCYANGHTYGTEGFWHTDSHRPQDISIVIYLNPTWDPQWAGDTLIKLEDGSVTATPVEPNSAVMFNGHLLHRASSVSRICPALRQCLVMKVAPEGCDPVRDQIQAWLVAQGAHKIRHSGRTLLTHLLMVYDLMTAQGCDATAAQAGGLHSIAGTNAFKRGVVGVEDLDTLKEQFGSDTIELVKLFNTVARPATLITADTTLKLAAGGTATVTPLQLAQLQQIEAANLLDQKVLGKYPALAQYWAGLKDSQNDK